MTDDAFDFLPEDLMTGHTIPAEMIRDLLAVARLDAGTVGRLAEHLSKPRGLMDESAFKDGLAACLQAPEAGLADRIVRTLFNIERSAVSQVIRTLDRWRRRTDERRSIFTDELFAGLERNLPALAGDYPAIQLIRKANTLLRDVGNEFRSVAFICDMRPVFDEPRTSVEGFVMLANMRLMYVSQEGGKHACEIALTEEELKELVSSGEKALSKLNVLKGLNARVAPSAGAMSAYPPDLP